MHDIEQADIDNEKKASQLEDIVDLPEDVFTSKEARKKSLKQTVSSSSVPSTKTSCTLMRKRFASNLRILVVAASAIVTCALMISYIFLDIYDIAPGPLTMHKQNQTYEATHLPKLFKTFPTLAKNVSEGGPVNKDSVSGIVDNLTSNPSVGSDISIVILDSKGKIVASKNEDVPRAPASTLKTLTAAVASRTLDMGSTLDTKVYLLPEATADTKNVGNSSKISKHGSYRLVLRGSGDMLLGVGKSDKNHVNGRAGLETLAHNTAEALKAKHITSVKFAVDDSLFGANRRPALIDKNDSEHRFYADTSSMAVDCARQRNLALQGVDADDPTDFPLSDPHPAESAGRTFADLLTREGISVLSWTSSEKSNSKSDESKNNENKENSENSGSSENSSDDSNNSAAENPTPEPIFVSYKKSLIARNANLLTKVSSAPLNEVMSYMLRHSDNTLAEEFGRLTALAVGEKNSPEGATAAISAGLKKLKVDTRGLHMSDCSGLSPDSTVRVITLAQVQLLNIRQGSGAAAAQGLSIPGLIGTARKRLSDENSAGFLRVKTGSLSDVTSMTGNVTRKNGGTIVFSVIINNPKFFFGAFKAVNDFMSALPNL